MGAGASTDPGTKGGPFDGHDGDVVWIHTVSGEGQYRLLTGGHDGRIGEWGLYEGGSREEDEIRPLWSQPGGVACSWLDVDPTTGTGTLYTCAVGGDLKEWRINPPPWPGAPWVRFLRRLDVAGGRAFGAMAGTSQWLILGTLDGRLVRVHRASGVDDGAAAPAGAGGAAAPDPIVHVTPLGARVLSVAASGRVVQVDPNTMELTAEACKPGWCERVTAAKLSGGLVYIATALGAIHEKDPHTGRELRRFQPAGLPGGPIPRAPTAIAVGRGRLYSASPSVGVSEFSLNSGREVTRRSLSREMGALGAVPAARRRGPPGRVTALAVGRAVGRLHLGFAWGTLTGLQRGVRRQLKASFERLRPRPRRKARAGMGDRAQESPGFVPPREGDPEDLGVARAKYLVRTASDAGRSDRSDSGRNLKV